MTVFFVDVESDGRLAKGSHPTLDALIEIVPSGNVTSVTTLNVVNDISLQARGIVAELALERLYVEMLSQMSAHVIASHGCVLALRRDHAGILATGLHEVLRQFLVSNVVRHHNHLPIK